MANVAVGSGGGTPADVPAVASILRAWRRESRVGHA